MMQAELFTDTLIQLMRDVFSRETLAPELRARIRARITSNLNVHGMELWTNPATPFGEAFAEDTPVVADQLWLFPEFDVPPPAAESTTFSLLSGSRN